MFFRYALWAAFCLLGVFVWRKRGDAVRVKNSLFLLTVFLCCSILARLAFLWLEPGLFSSLSFFQIIAAFKSGLAFDWVVFALLGGPFVLLGNLPYGGGRWQRVCLGAGMLSAGLTASALAGNMAYFHLTGHHTGADVWNLFTTFGLVWAVAWREYKGALVACVLGTAFFVWAGLRVARRNGSPARGPRPWEIIGWLMLLWLLWCAAHGHAMLSSRLYTAGVAQGHLAQNGVFGMLYELNPRWFRPLAKRLVVPPSVSAMTEAEAVEGAKELLSSSQEKYAASLFPLLRRREVFNADARGKNLVILVLESLEYKYVDALAGTSYGATPNLDVLIRQGVSFDRFYSCSQGSSLEGIGAVMSGVCRVTGLRFFARGLEELDTERLGALFGRAGYRSVFVQASADGWMFIGPLARLMGFESYDDAYLAKRFGRKKAYDYDALMFLAGEMDKTKEPFFGFFFSSGTHEPLGMFVPEDWPGENRERFEQKSYLYSLAYTDWAVGELMRRLRENGKYENTVFVILGDHRARTEAHPDAKRLDDLFRVPLVITAPGVLPAGRSPRIGGQASLLPTLADLFHISAPYGAMGNSLLDDSAEEFAFVSYFGGTHFGGVFPQGVVLDDEAMLPRLQYGPEKIRRRIQALNASAYYLLRAGRWREKQGKKT